MEKRKKLEENVTIIIDVDFNIYVVEMYGAKTWGDGYHQNSMYQNEKGEYIIESWSYGGEWEEDTTYESKVDVIAEFGNFKDVENFLIKNNHADKLETLKAIQEDYKLFLDWVIQDEKR